MSERTELAKKAVEHARLQLQEALQELFNSQMVDSGLSIGQIVYYKGKKVRVEHVKFSFIKPWIIGCFQLKDGTWSDRTKNCFDDWTLQP